MFFFTIFLLILVGKAQMFPGTWRILWKSSGVGNLTQPLISHVLLLLSKMDWHHLSRTYNLFTCLSRTVSYNHQGWLPLQSFIQSCWYQTTRISFLRFTAKHATTELKKQALSYFPIFCKPRSFIYCIFWCKQKLIVTVWFNTTRQFLLAENERFRKKHTNKLSIV